MATPTVFVSSTFYDLRYARESLKRFVEQIGYVPILSEDGTVFYDPRTTAAEACLQEVANADILVLLIGGRYGMEMESGKSVTNAEYQQAVASKIPVFALVDHGTHNDYLVYRANMHTPEIVNQMTFPNADSVKIFEFIDSVRTQTENNALVPFRTIADIETYLRAQWAGMMHDYVSTGTKQAQVVDTLDMLTRVNERVELIASQILRSVGSPIDRLYVNLMKVYVESATASDLRYFGKFTPLDVLRFDTVEQCAEAAGRPILPWPDPEENETSNIISGSGQVTQPKLRQMRRSYNALRQELTELQSKAGVSLSDLETYEADLDIDAGPRLPATDDVLAAFDGLLEPFDDAPSSEADGDVAHDAPSLAGMAEQLRRAREADSTDLT